MVARAGSEVIYLSPYPRPVNGTGLHLALTRSECIGFQPGYWQTVGTGDMVQPTTRSRSSPPYQGRSTQVELAYGTWVPMPALA